MTEKKYIVTSSDSKIGTEEFRNQPTTESGKVFGVNADGTVGLITGTTVDDVTITRDADGKLKVKDDKFLELTGGEMVGSIRAGASPIIEGAYPTTPVLIKTLGDDSTSYTSLELTDSGAELSHTQPIIGTTEYVKLDVLEGFTYNGNKVETTNNRASNVTNDEFAYPSSAAVVRYAVPKQWTATDDNKILYIDSSDHTVKAKAGGTVEVDDETIGVENNKLYVKDGGVTLDKLANQGTAHTGKALVIGSDGSVALSSGSYVLKSGDTMAGGLNMGNYQITNLKDPTTSSGAATKAYADKMLPLAGGTMSGSIVGVNTSGITLAALRGPSTASQIVVTGDTRYNYGGRLLLNGATHSNAGCFWLCAGDNSTDKYLAGKPDGTLTWDSKPIMLNDYSTGTPGHNSTYIGKNYSSYFRVGRIIIVSINIQISTAVQSGYTATFLMGLPAAVVTTYGAISIVSSNNYQSAKLYIGANDTSLILNGGCPTGWASGNMVYISAS